MMALAARGAAPLHLLLVLLLAAGLAAAAHDDNLYDGSDRDFSDAAVQVRRSRAHYGGLVLNECASCVQVRLLVPSGDQETVLSEMARRFERHFGAQVDLTPMPSNADLFNNILADVVGGCGCGGCSGIG